MRFFHQDEGSKVSTKCIRVSSTASTRDVLNTLIEKFRPDMRMLSLPEYSLYEVHVNGGKIWFNAMFTMNKTRISDFSLIYFNKIVHFSN